MATSTPNINLRKPAGSDLVNVTTDLAENFDKIDEAIDLDRDALAAHLADVNGTHGYPAPGDLALTSHTHSGVELDDHVHPELEPAGSVVTHNSDTTGVHGIANTANLALVGHTHEDTHDHDGDYEPLGSAQATVDAAIADIVANAPATLDTLNEIANALGDDPNLATTLSTQIAEKADADHTHGEIGSHNHNAAYEALGSVATHSADTTAVHGIADTALLLTLAAHALIDHDDIPGSGDVAVQAEAPASPDVGDLWLDSDETVAPGGGGGGAAITQQDAEPASPAEDDLWIDTDDGVLKRYNGTAWETVGGGGGFSVLTQSQDSAGLTTAATAYTAGDVVGNGWTFTNVAAAAGGTGLITGVTLLDDGDVSIGFDLYIAKAAITFGTDNAAPSVSDADAAHIVAVVGVSMADVGASRVGSATGLAIPYVCDGTSLYVYARTMDGHTFFVAADDLHLRLFWERSS